MGDLESLLLVIVCVYLFECCVWVRKGGVAVFRYWPRRWHVGYPGRFMGNARGAIFLVNPLPPLGTLFVCYPFPLSVSPEGMFSFNASSLCPVGRPAQLGRWVPFATVRSIHSDGRRVLVDDSLFLVASSSASARRLVGILGGLRAAPERERADLIRAWVAAALSGDQMKSRWSAFLKAAPALGWLPSSLFCYLFILCPALLWKFSLGSVGGWLAGGLLVQTLLIGSFFYRAHRTLFPGGAEERLTPFLTMLLAPPTAIRAPDLLARHLMEELHPLAVVRGMCSGPAFESFARHALLDLHFPLLPVCPRTDPEAERVESWFRGLVLEEMERAVTEAGLDLVQLLGPPNRSEPGNQSYCPRCRTQFIRVSGVCGDCGGRPLAAWGDRMGC